MVGEEAVALANRGWPVFPVNGKVPVTSRGFKDATVDAGLIRKLWRRHPSSGIGLRCGLEGAGLFAVDIDPRHGGHVDALLAYGELPRTLESATGGGGTHLLFRQDQSVKSRAGVLPGIDIRADGGYVVVPPSPHESGACYAWRDGRGPDDVEIAAAPQWLMTLLDGAKSTRGKASTTDTDVINEGSRNATLASVAGTLRREGLDGEGMFLVLRQLNAAKCRPPLEEREVRSIVESITRYDPAGRQYPRTDSGNAERFAAHFGTDVRFVTTWGKWLVWNGAFWEPDSALVQVQRRAKTTARRIVDEAQACPDDEARKALLKWAFQSESRGRLSNIVSLAAAEDGLSVSHEDFDRQDHLLNLANGTYDLKTWTFRPHQREDLITRCVPIAYDKGATCPIWVGFVDRIMAGQKRLISFLQRAVGYSLTGDVGEQVLFFLYGGGANGKSTFCLLDLVGPYGVAGAPSLLLAKQGEAHPTEQTDLCGARVVVCQEVEAGRAWAEVTLKQLTGGDTIKARRMREDFWSFRPTHKFWVAANHRPTVRGSDLALWRRLLLVPFAVTIPPAERDPELLEKLRAELPGILNWAIDGAKLWVDCGLAPPPEVAMATEAYRQAEDLVTQFIEQECVVDPNEKVAATALYSVYKDWCERAGEAPLKQRGFGDRLTDLGYPPKGGKVARSRVGLRLLDEDGA